MDKIFSLDVYVSVMTSKLPGFKVTATTIKT